MSGSNRSLRAGLAFLLICLPALAAGPAVARAADRGMDKTFNSSADEAALNVVEKDDLPDSQGPGSEVLETQGKDGAPEDAGEKLAAADLDEKEVDDAAEEAGSRAEPGTADIDNGVAGDDEHEQAGEDRADLKEVSEMENEAEQAGESEADDKGEQIEIEDSGINE